MKHRLAIFLSGSGSNARNICQYFDSNSDVEVALLLTNKENSGAKAIGEAFGIPYFLFNKEQFYQSDEVISKLSEYNIDTLILAGFLWLMPENILSKYENHVINIHPALLPKYGGKGMHGINVHKAVFENGEEESGITIHLCNKEYDKGKILFQKKVRLEKTDQAEDIAQKVLKLEHYYFPRVIEQYLLQ